MKSLTKMFTLFCWCLVVCSTVFSNTVEMKLKLEQEIKDQKAKAKVKVNLTEKIKNNEQQVIDSNGSNKLSETEQLEADRLKKLS